ncbi:MAG: type II toxin-antitoxin system VapC family toxin [Pirellulales bacterium]
MFLLDTDHLVILQRQSEPDYSRLRAAMTVYAASDFFLSIVSFHEQVLGANAFISQAKTPESIVRGYQMMELCLIDFNRFHVLPFDAPAAGHFKALRPQLRIGTMDLRIAVTALSQSLTVLTRNTVDFTKVPNLLVDDWLSSE